jgi:hypothetical protein
MHHLKVIHHVSSVGFATLLVLMALLTTPGCMSTQTASPVAESLDSLGISIRGVRENNIRVAYRYGLTVEQAADSIITLTTDQTTKVNANLWKMYCIPVIRQIYSQSDPFMSGFDGLAFSMQCREYFTTGIGKDRFGAQQQIAISAMESIERRLVEGNRLYLTSGNVDSLITITSRWAEKNPLTNNLFERTSIVKELDYLFARHDYSVGSAVGRIADDVDDLSGRLSLLAAQLPREARWQGEYLLTDLALKDRLKSLDTTIVVLRATLASLEKELGSGGLAVDITSIQPLHSTIKAALEQLGGERAIVMADLDRIRVATLADAEEAANRAVSGWLDHADAIVDRILWKIGIFLAVLFTAVALLLLYLRKTSRRQRRQRDALS